LREALSSMICKRKEKRREEKRKEEESSQFIEVHKEDLGG